MLKEESFNTQHWLVDVSTIDSLATKVCLPHRNCIDNSMVEGNASSPRVCGERKRRDDDDDVMNKSDRVTNLKLRSLSSRVPTCAYGTYCLL
jgi:hypothetical protein